LLDKRIIIRRPRQGMLKVAGEKRRGLGDRAGDIGSAGVREAAVVGKKHPMLDEVRGVIIPQAGVESSAGGSARHSDGGLPQLAGGLQGARAKSLRR